MVLEIHNIGKIQKAAIEMRGITVIAGSNNTGKSTYGKVLYCIFNAFSNADAKIREERRRGIAGIIVRFMRPGHYADKIDTIIDDITEHHSSENEIRSLLEKAMNDKIIFIGKKDTVDIDSIIERIVQVGEVTDEQIQKMILTHYLRAEFGNRIVHVNHSEDTGRICLTINGNRLSASINNDECTDFTDNVGIIYEAFYIDTPFILDEMDAIVVYWRDDVITYEHNEHLQSALLRPVENIGAVEEILVKQKLQRILSAIRSIVDGEFEQDQNAEGLQFQEKGLNAPLGMCNISTGMKPFLIIKRLLETGGIKERGVLVLDEPEIHLHPEWQLKYAELLVLLQKELNLTILLTTHSPYFLNAIEVYSKKHGLDDRCNYYLTDTEGDACTIKEVTENTDLVYKKLARPFQELENLRYKED